MSGVVKVEWADGMDDTEIPDCEGIISDSGGNYYLPGKYARHVNGRLVRIITFIPYKKIEAQ